MNNAPRQIRLLMELRGQGVHDVPILSAIERIPREIFVPSQFQDQSYENTPLPIGHGQTISQPSIVALMLQALEINKRHKVLEIGTGSGYQTALLALLCRRVYTIERIPELAKSAEEIFKKLQMNNITTKIGDGAKGWPEQKPFDRIIAAAVADEAPPSWFDQLAEGGIMILPLGEQGGDQHVVKITKKNGEMLKQQLWPVRFVPLVTEENPALRKSG
ncbi:MAG: protein-L-isoaspartate(D-aspartate) O-methyltransferase [Dongiaceae bacterium]